MKLTTLSLCLFLASVCWGQSQWVVTKELWRKGQTTFVEAKQARSDSIGYFPIHFMGMGKRRNLTGLQGTFHPYGIRKRKHILYFTINEL